MKTSDQLSTCTVFLEPLVDSASSELLSALLESKAELCRYMAWECWDIEAVNGFIEGAMRNRAERAGYQFAIRRVEDGSLVGMIGLTKFDPFTPKAEVGYWVRTSMTGKGYATAALGAVLDVCRDELKLTRVDACAADSNVASQKVLLNCGFEQEGLKRKAQYCHGQWLDMVLFGTLLA